MKKKYTYEFVNETVEIEIDEEWEAILEEEDRKEYNSNKKETRRHLKLDPSFDCAEWIKDEKENPERIIEANDAEKKLMDAISEIMTDKQFNAFEKICINRYTEEEFAEMVGITHQAAHKAACRAKELIAISLKNKINTMFF